MKLRATATFFAVVHCSAVSLCAQQVKLVPPSSFVSHRPNFPPVHISPYQPQEQALGTNGPDYWSRHGEDLKSLLGITSRTPITRIDFPDVTTATQKLDFDLVLPKTESMQVMSEIVQAALAQKFHLKITQETRALDVYVLTAPDGPASGMHLHSPPGGSSSVNWHTSNDQWATGEQRRKLLDQKVGSPDVLLTAITSSNGLLRSFCLNLEEGLDRPVINETNLPGGYDFEIDGITSQAELFRKLHDELGLVVTPSRRDVAILVVTPL
jgi:uncharacterized protein (TIGR03435 family)